MIKKISLFLGGLLMAASIFSCNKENKEASVPTPDSITGKSYQSTEAINGDGFVMCFTSSDEAVELKLLGNDVSNSEKIRDMKYSYTKPNLTFNPGTKDEIKSIIKGSRFSIENIQFEEIPAVADTFAMVKKVKPFIIPGYND